MDWEPVGFVWLVAKNQLIHHQNQSGKTMKKTYLASALLALLVTAGVQAQNTFPAKGHVGIGTTSPTYPFHVNSTSTGTRARFQFGPALIDLVNYSQGTLPYSNSSGMFVSNQDGLLMVGNNKDLRFVTYTSQYVERMRIKANGNVGIGTLNPAHRLEVNGTVRAREVKLEATQWPDYVFGESYPLMPLEEVNSHIRQKGHLPGLKPAGEYEAEGVNMLELSQKLLEKIEELTLYLIRQEKDVKAITSRIDALVADAEQKD